MAEITRELTTVTVGGTEYTLVPTLAAVRAVTAACGGLLPAFRKVQDLDLDAMASIIVAGARLTLTAKEYDALAGAVWKTEKKGPIGSACIDFLSLLLNGGRSVEDEVDGAEAEGNV